MQQNQTNKIKLFHELHNQSKMLILPNAWDAISSRIFEQNEAQAIGTTSAGIAASLGFADGENIPLDLFFAVVERIISSVNIPVSVDIESGMGLSISQICANVENLLEVGIAGINIEDGNPYQTGELFSLSQQTEKIKSIKEFVKTKGYNVFINARIDTYWINTCSNTNVYSFDDTIERILAYKVAGADGIFVPGLTDLTFIKNLSTYSTLPLNILGGAWVTSLNELQSCGVKRLSMGSSLVRSIATIINHMSNQVINSGTSSYFTNIMSYKEFNNLFI